MLKIKALNRESSSDEDTPVIRREAQEEIVLELYNNALRLQTEEVFIEAESILCKLIDENIPLLENNGGLPKSMANLKYSCNVNIGNIYLKLNRVNDALDRYLMASQLDGTDVTLWHKIGNLSLNQNKFHQSVYAFAKGLECSESHWPCLDKLISVLYAVKDTIACLDYIGKALSLDPYYTKGLVLRKQIYKDNPATKDYYKLYNPDSIWEPPLDVPIAEEDENVFLEEAQVLCDKVTEVERRFAPKPLQTIALPKPLNDFTWLSLTETIIFIHQYLKDNEMSHFTMIDMKKCMSQVEEPVFKFPQSEQSNDLNAVDDKADDNKTPQVNAETCNNEEKMETDQIQERRSSQNSEINANEVQENTPVQTDNDEEQNMDQDTEEQDETVETKERGRPRGSKRKRDVISDLQTWGWYSRRKLSKKAKEKDFTVEDALDRIIPKYLLPYRIDPEKFTNFEDSMNTMDLYNLYMESNNVNYLSPIHSPKSVNYEQYFGTDRELEDVREFWTKPRDCYDVVVLIKDLVYHLSKIWQYKWPKELVPLYLKAYSMFREHCDPPQVFCGGHTFEELRNDALASILFGELSFFSCDSKESIPPTLLGNMRLISGWQDEWKDEYPSFFIRVYWLQSHLFRKENNNDLAVTALQLIQETIEDKETNDKEKYMLSLPNCFKYGLINIEITRKIFKHLDMINSLSTVEILYNSEKYTEVADILKQTFNGGPYPQVGRMGRPAQLGLLLHSLWFTDMGDCFVWAEECLNEAFEQHLKFNKEQDKWEKVVEKCLAILYEIIKHDTICVVDLLKEGKRARIVQMLSKIISKQLNLDSSKLGVSSVTPWILLHFVLLREEQREYAKRRIKRGKREKQELNPDTEEPVDCDLPPSVAILFSAHEFLGPRGLCLVNQGELLHFIIDTILDKLDTPIFERMRDKIDIHIEQAMFCLYQHPSKKNKVSRHLADHNVDPLPLSWERACQLFEFYGPDQLPEFNSYKNASISVDLEQLFKRIIALVPSSNALQHHLPKIMDYIHGKTDKILEPIDFPRKVKPIYFLIGDFYFKQREFNKCIKYFQMDLCINPQRLDSWACLGLSYAAQLDTKLNHCEKFKSEMEFLDKAKFASICFKRALDICPDPLMLWIECGTFQYTVHSYCSRVMKFESENLSMERFEFLENQKNSYLDSSGNSFEKAISLYEMEENNDADERWLQYYILGKIAEKKQKEPSEYLQYYQTAITLLDENKAEYPEKINYNNPQHLSVEALELHYRIHASVLKYLELHEGKDIPTTLGVFFKKCLGSSKLLRKQPPPPPPPPPPAEPSVESEVPIQATSSSSVSYQEQFLNSLNKTGSHPEEIETNNEENADSEKADKETKNITNEKKTPTEKTDVKPAAEESAKVEIIDDDDVIMIISDSDDDDVKIITVNDDEKKEMSDKTHNNSEVTVNGNEKIEKFKDISTDTNGTVKEINHQIEMDKKLSIVEVTKKDVEVNVVGNQINDMSEEKVEKINQINKNETTSEETDGVKLDIKDVQKMLDEMMVQTMKETEERTNELDSDLSGTEKIEEVVLKDEQESADVKMEIKTIEAYENKCDAAIKPKKTKLNDGGPNTENKKASPDESSSGSSSSSCSSDSSDSDSDDDDDDSSSSSSSSSSDGTNEFMSNSDISHLIDKCVTGLEICIIRLTQNYKALYRLAHLYFNYKPKKDMNKCKQLLLSEYKCKDGTTVSGLFGDRKPNNFFNGIWRIPSTEIDRPGSLSAHMSRCLSLLMQILRNTNDNKTLIDLCVQLRRIPEPDKIYVKDSERMSFSEQALTVCIQSIRSQIKHVTNMSNPHIAKLLQEIFKIYQRLAKHAPGKETPFANLLVEVYKRFIKEKIPENVNVLELAIKFCIQNRSAEKHRIQGTTPKTPMFVPRVAGLSTSAPVMPSPQTISPALTTPLKRPGGTRPRGRPPLQKTPGHTRYPRPKSPSTAGISKTYAWQKSLMDQSYAYEYLKHYQDELIKQYSQNLSIAQLTQLSQILTQGQINNPLTATAITSQMLAQTGLLNSNLIKQMNSAGNVNSSNAPSQFMDTLNQLNPNVKKKLGVDQALSSLTSDQLKLLGTLVPKQSSSGVQTKSPVPHTITSASGIISSKQNKQASALRTSMQNAMKSSLLDSPKTKQSSNTPPPPKGIPTPPPKNIPTPPPKNTLGSQIFKEPGINKSRPSDERTAKDLMKDRPNISIIPVSVALPPPPPSISPSFMRQNSTSPSGASGKTLQEKLAEKKKEQQNKQMKNGDGEKRQTDALMKTLNITSLPSSLTVSPALLTSSPSIIKTPDSSQGIFHYPKSPNVNPKFPLDVSMQPSSCIKPLKEQPLPASLTVSRASSSSTLVTPSFSADSGISISQISTSQRKSEDNITSSSDKQQNILRIPVSSAVNISPAKTQNVIRSNISESSFQDIENSLKREAKKKLTKKQKFLGIPLNSGIDISPVRSDEKSKKIKNTALSQKTSKNSIYKRVISNESKKHKSLLKYEFSKKLEEISKFESKISQKLAKSDSFKSVSSNSENPRSKSGSTKKLNKLEGVSSKQLDNSRVKSTETGLKSESSKKAKTYLKSESFKKLEDLTKSGLSVVSGLSKQTIIKFPNQPKPISLKNHGVLESEMSKKLEILSKSGVQLKTIPLNRVLKESASKAESQSTERVPSKKLVDKQPLGHKSVSDDDDVICID